MMYYFTSDRRFTIDYGTLNPQPAGHGSWSFDSGVQQLLFAGINWTLLSPSLDGQSLYLLYPNAPGGAVRFKYIKKP